jgi:hypothetical protein
MSLLEVVDDRSHSTTRESSLEPEGADDVLRYNVGYAFSN